MNLIFRRVLGLAVLTFTFSANTSAGLIDYQFNSQTGHIENIEQRLEYLHFTATNGMTVVEAIDAFGADGWSVASDEQGARLIADANNWHSRYYDSMLRKLSISGYASDYYSDPLGDLFGYTSYSPEGFTDANGWTIAEGTDRETINFRYGNANDDGFYNIYHVSGSYSEYNIKDPAQYFYNRSGSVGMNYTYDTGTNRSYGSVLMVRAVDVPEPSSLVLLGAGLLGCLKLRKKG